MRSFGRPINDTTRTSEAELKVAGAIKTVVNGHLRHQAVGSWSVKGLQQLVSLVLLVLPCCHVITPDATLEQETRQRVIEGDSFQGGRSVTIGVRICI